MKYCAWYILIALIVFFIGLIFNIAWLFIPGLICYLGLILYDFGVFEKRDKK